LSSPTTAGTALLRLNTRCNRGDCCNRYKSCSNNPLFSTEYSTCKIVAGTAGQLEPITITYIKHISIYVRLDNRHCSNISSRLQHEPSQRPLGRRSGRVFTTQQNRDTPILNRFDFRFHFDVHIRRNTLQRISRTCGSRYACSRRRAVPCRAQLVAIRLRAIDLAWPSRGQRSPSRCPRLPRWARGRHRASRDSLTTMTD